MILAISEDTQNCKSSQTESIPTEADECQTELTAEDLKKTKYRFRKRYHEG